MVLELKYSMNSMECDGKEEDEPMKAVIGNGDA